MQKTIEYVQPKAREWQSPQGQTVSFITVNFSDNTEGSVATVPAKVEEVMGILEGLKGKPEDYDLEAKGEYNGIAQFKVKNYPGKPAGGGGGGGRGGGGMSHTQAGMLAAASYLAGSTHSGTIQEQAEHIIELSELLTQHLFDRKPPEQEQQQSSGGGQAPGNQITLAQMKALKELIEGAGWSGEDLKTRVGVESLSELSSEDAGILIESLQGKQE